MDNKQNLGQSATVYIANAACVMACLGAIIFTAMQPGIESSVIAVVAGTSGTIAGSLLTIMLKASGIETEKRDPMHDVALKLLDNLGEQVTVEAGKVQVQRGDQVTTVDRPDEK